MSTAAITMGHSKAQSSGKQRAINPILLRWLIVAAAMTGSVLEVLDTSITNVAVPQMMGNLGATLSEIGWVSTGYIISNVIILPMTGWLSDRFGRRNYFTAAILIFTMASLLCGLSHSLEALIFWRVVQGLGGGGLLATGQVIMLEAFPQEQQGLATAVFGVGVMVGPSLGPVLGGWLTDNLSWPWIFFVNIPFGIAAAIMTQIFVPNPKHQELTQQSKAPVDYMGVILLAAGMGSLQTVLERGQQEDWFNSNLIIGLSLIAVAGLATFVWWELRNPHPIVDLHVFRDRSLAAGSIFGLVLGVGLYATLFLLPVFLQNSQGYTAFQTGMILLPLALISMPSFMMAGPLSHKVDARILLAAGALMMMVSCFLLGNLTTQTGESAIYWPLLLRGFSLGFLFIPLTVASLADLTPQQIGTGSGMINLTRQLGGSIGIAALSTVMTRRAVFHYAAVSSHLSNGDPNVTGWLADAQQSLIVGGSSVAAAHNGALALLSSTVMEQAMILSYNDCFLIIGICFAFALPLVLIFNKPKMDADISGAH